MNCTKSGVPSDFTGVDQSRCLESRKNDGEESGRESKSMMPIARFVNRGCKKSEDCLQMPKNRLLKKLCPLEMTLCELRRFSEGIGPTKLKPPAPAS
jgi:hypothetical protein